MDVYKLIREGERRALKAYFSGEPLEQVCRRFGYSRIRIKAMAEDYKSGKIDIFGPMDKKKFDKQFKEVDQLKARVAELEEAMGKFPAGTLQGLIHHSDRGAQYCSKEYVSVLRKNGIRVSMTENGDPYENAIAERTNGILKTEWLYHEVLRGPAHAQKRIDEIIYTYNHRRPHMSIGNLAPEEARSMKGEAAKLWKNYFALKHESVKTALACQ